MPTPKLDPSQNPASPEASGSSRTVKKITDPKEVVDMAGKDQSFWRDRNTRMEEMQDLIEQEGEVDSSDPETAEVLSNDGAVIVRKLSAMVGSQSPAHNIYAPESLSDIAERSEDLLRAARFTEEMRHVQGLRAPLPYDEAQSIFLRGWVTGRIMVNPDDPEDFLWDYTLADPLTVFPRYGRKALTRVTTITKTTNGEIVEDWGDAALKLLGDNFDEDESTTLYGYYDQTQMALATDAGWLKEPTPHQYPFGCPWVIALGPGAFYRQTDKKSTGWTKFVGQGILDIVKDQIRNEEQVLTMLHQLVAREAEPPTVAYVNNTGQVVKIDLRSGARNVLYNTEKLELLRVGPNIADLKLLAETYRDMVSRGTFPPMLFGDNAPNLTGYLTHLLQGSARDMIWPYLRALEAYYTQLDDRHLALFREFGVEQSIVRTNRVGQRVGGAVIERPEVLQLGNHPQIEVRYRDVTPQDEQAKATIGSMAVRDNILSRDSVRRKYYDVDDPIKEQTKVLGEKALEDQMAVTAASALSIQKMAQDRNMTLEDLLGVVSQVTSVLGPGGQGPGQAPAPVNSVVAPNLQPPAESGVAPGDQLLGPEASGPPSQFSQQLPFAA